MKTILERPRRKLIAGQRSLIDPEEPPVTYCLVCGRRLKTPQSIEHQMGPTCLRKSKEHGCRSEEE
ncbi:hypothetical protein KOR42_41630 [Thalassoglobus neptunius]|uniref:Uncharacterized protein n=1 Tax=Thalassoglobus neptunius TaxID=1938619 RepID=A0A5C5WAH5_9PLAN|nr:DUF6011 domain-containing protein [Thalassoglobus neptunius]TWT47165.1 hypothetical protein KOR42_41630 [Thalassoglobus neptunius]